MRENFNRIRLKGIIFSKGEKKTHIITCFQQANHTKRLDYFNSSSHILKNKCLIVKGSLVFNFKSTLALIYYNNNNNISIAYSVILALIGVSLQCFTRFKFSSTLNLKHIENSL